MKTATPPEIRRYLAAVEREAAALPAQERRELVPDLDEHIRTTLAELPPGSAPPPCRTSWPNSATPAPSR